MLVYSMKKVHLLPVVVLLLQMIGSIECDRQDMNVELSDSIYNGFTDRQIILELVKRIGNLEKWNHELEKRSEEAEKRNDNQQQVIVELQKTLRQQNRRMGVMERVLKPDYQTPETEQPLEPLVSSSSREMGAIREDNPGEREDRSYTSSHQQHKRNKPKDGIVRKDVKLTGEIQQDNQHPIVRQLESEARVAFYARAATHLDNLGTGQILEFSNVTTNIGNAYNSNTGVFQAPVTGTYVFSVSLMGLSASHDSHYYIAKNRASVSEIYVEGAKSPYTTSSHTVILQLSRGDDVEIRNHDSGQGVYISYSSFSGFLLYVGDGSSIVVGR